MGVPRLLLKVPVRKRYIYTRWLQEKKPDGRNKCSVYCVPADAATRGRRGILCVHLSFSPEVTQYKRETFKICHQRSISSAIAGSVIFHAVTTTLSTLNRIVLCWFLCHICFLPDDFEMGGRTPKPFVPGYKWTIDA
jgi:hypothetical protein